MSQGYGAIGTGYGYESERFLINQPPPPYQQDNNNNNNNIIDHDNDDNIEHYEEEEVVQIRNNNNMMQGMQQHQHQHQHQQTNTIHTPPSLFQQLVAECVGTCILTQIGCAGLCVSMFMHEDDSSGGNGGALGQVVFIWLLAAVLAVTSVFSISGAHLNPAVSVSYYACVFF